MINDLIIEKIVSHNRYKITETLNKAVNNTFISQFIVIPITINYFILCNDFPEDMKYILDFKTLSIEIKTKIHQEIVNYFEILKYSNTLLIDTTDLYEITFQHLLPINVFLINSREIYKFQNNLSIIKGSIYKNKERLDLKSRIYKCENRLCNDKSYLLRLKNLAYLMQDSLKSFLNRIVNETKVCLGCKTLLTEIIDLRVYSKKYEYFLTDKSVSTHAVSHLNISNEKYFQGIFERRNNGKLFFKILSSYKKETLEYRHIPLHLEDTIVNSFMYPEDLNSKSFIYLENESNKSCNKIENKSDKDFYSSKNELDKKLNKIKNDPNKDSKNELNYSIIKLDAKFKNTKYNLKQDLSKPETTFLNSPLQLDDKFERFNYSATIVHLHDITNFLFSKFNNNITIYDTIILIILNILSKTNEKVLIYTSDTTYIRRCAENFFKMKNLNIKISYSLNSFNNGLCIRPFEEIKTKDILYVFQIPINQCLDYSYNNCENIYIENLDCNLNEHDHNSLQKLFLKFRNEYKRIIEPERLLRTLTSIYLSIKEFVGDNENINVFILEYFLDKLL